MLENKKPYDLPANKLIQEYDKYSADDHEVWKTLYSRQMVELKENATKDFFKGLKLCGFESNKIPQIKTVNQNLIAATGWRTYVVPGLIADKPFFQYLANRRFPVTTWIRKKNELEYLEEPDMFHDVFAHVPLLSIQSFVDFVQGLAKIALKHIENPHAVEMISRLYWFTVEFGLIKEEGQIKIYGAGILSSIGESDFAVQDKDVPRHPYDVRHIVQTPFYKHDFQKQYFVIDSYDQLYESLAQIENIINEELEAS